MTFRSLLVAVLLAGAATADAHSALERAEPRGGSRLKMAPVEIKLWFTEKLEPAFSTLRVEDRAGRRVDRADGRVDDEEPTLMRVSLTPLAPGTYHVLWRVLSVDGHVTDGAFSFRFEP